MTIDDKIICCRCGNPGLPYYSNLCEDCWVNISVSDDIEYIKDARYDRMVSTVVKDFNKECKDIS